MSNSEELVIFMRLELGVEQTLIPGVLASRGVPFTLLEQHRERYVLIMVPASRLEQAQRAVDDAKELGKLLKEESDV